MFVSVCLFLITIELIFIFFNVEPKVSLKGLYVSDPTAGYALNPKFSMKNHNWFRPYHISINSQGLRGSEFAVNKKNNLRILVLGDSITFGIYVEDDETFCRLLEREAREKGIPLEVLNGGIGGYSPKIELLWFCSKGIFFEPDIVILVLFVGNDVKGELREVGDFMVRNGLLYYRGRMGNDEEEAPTNNIYYWFRARRIYQFICHKYWRLKKMFEMQGKEGFLFSEMFERKGFPKEEEAYDRLMSSIRGLGKMCQEKDIGFLMVLVPTYEQVYSDELNIRERSKYDMKRPNRRIVAMAWSEGIPVLDLLETNDFRVKKDLYLPLERIHLSVEGHRVVAENLYTFLRDRGSFRGLAKRQSISGKAARRDHTNNSLQQEYNIRLNLPRTERN
jgi:lysophospholipase L1-like esterase